MAATNMTSREFNQDTARAKRAANRGPVFITDRGRPGHVLLSMDEYNKLAGKKQNIMDLIEMPGIDQIDFEFPEMKDEMARPAEFE
ncbi:MAG TPA: type II toxin-antitoxin system prevent-host-death family antitoxin [Terracidiphilus sp.]|nr:type II toxin-antitoxin system prevent-host-death family antitoxin [Terracidiphilus sp.]